MRSAASGFTGCRKMGSPSARIVHTADQIQPRRDSCVDMGRHVNAAYARQLRCTFQFLERKLRRLHRERRHADKARRMLLMSLGQASL